MAVYALSVAGNALGTSNLVAGRAVHTWGWKDEAVSVVANEIGQSGLEILAGMSLDDTLIIAHGGAGRVGSDAQWIGSTLNRIVICRVTRTYFTDATPIWTDDVYPNRIEFEEVDERTEISGGSLDPQLLSAIKWSASVRALPMPLGSLPLLDGSAAAVPPGFFASATDLDNWSLRRGRVEQAALRKRLLAGKAIESCVLCGRSYNVQHLIAAHIKKRSKCSLEEKKDTTNAMLNCATGCDSLYEAGCVAVATDGKIVANPSYTPTSAEAALIGSLVGRVVGPYAVAGKYFDFHRTEICGMP